MSVETTQMGQFMKRKRGALIVTGFSPHTISAEQFEIRLFSNSVELIFMHADGVSPCVEGCLETVLQYDRLELQ